MTQLDDPHLRPFQTLLLWLERAKQELFFQGPQDQVPSQLYVLCSVDLLPRWGPQRPVAASAQECPVPLSYRVVLRISSMLSSAVGV